MAITAYPITGNINAADHASAIDKLFGGLDHANADLAFELKLLSQAGGLNTWQLTAGAYILDGYVFISDGTETVTVGDSSAKSICLYYVLTGGYITAAGIDESSKKPSGAIETILWVVNGPVGGSSAPSSITDNRRINTWGRTAYANTDADAITLAATRAVVTGSLTSLKRFRVAYPGSYQLTFEHKGNASFAFVQVNRGGTVISTTSISNASDWTTWSNSINNCQPGDIISVEGQDLEVRSAYLRYKLSDLGSSAVLVD